MVINKIHLQLSYLARQPLALGMREYLVHQQLRWLPPHVRIKGGDGQRWRPARPAAPRLHQVIPLLSPSLHCQIFKKCISSQFSNSLTPCCLGK